MKVFVYSKPSPNTIGKKIRDAVYEVRQGAPLVSGPVVLRLRFIFWRDPQSPKAVPLGEVSVDALQRAVMRELVGALYEDERQVISTHAIKEYGNVNGVEIRA
jgi:hypothetical protein